eukprot:3434423-Prymnesium_polylepis.1
MHHGARRRHTRLAPRPTAPLLCAPLPAPRAARLLSGSPRWGRSAASEWRAEQPASMPRTKYSLIGPTQSVPGWRVRLATRATSAPHGATCAATSRAASLVRPLWWRGPRGATRGHAGPRGATRGHAHARAQACGAAVAGAPVCRSPTCPCRSAVASRPSACRAAACTAARTAARCRPPSPSASGTGSRER